MPSVIRVVIIYVFLVIVLRIMGKREFNQLSSLEFVTLLLIPEIFSQSLAADDNSLTNAFIGCATLLSLVFISSVLHYRSKKFEKLISSEPTVLVTHGHVLRKHLDRERVSIEEIFAEMRLAGLERLEQVKWAILETEGEISIVPFEGNK